MRARKDCVNLDLVLPYALIPRHCGLAEEGRVFRGPRLHNCSVVGQNLFRSVHHDQANVCHELRRGGDEGQRGEQGDPRRDSHGATDSRSSFGVLANISGCFAHSLLFGLLRCIVSRESAKDKINGGLT